LVFTNCRYKSTVATLIILHRGRNHFSFHFIRYSTCRKIFQIIITDLMEMKSMLHYHAHKRLLLDPILSHMHPVILSYHVPIFMMNRILNIW